MSCINDSYMEYSIMTTNRCNLKCSYCINSGRRKNEPGKKADAVKIISHILKDAKENHYSPVVITFYGGEPLLEQGLINEIMEGTAELHPMFNMFTNGTLISKENLELLNRMYMVSVSIDGDSKLHDEIRGKGSFQKTLNNFISIKSELKARVIAFVTVTQRTRVYDSVMGLKEYFDDIFWFLENSDAIDNLPGFISDYESGIDKLVENWVSNLRSGKVLNFIPFQGLYDILEKKHVYSGLPCGIGENFQAIAIDGSVYSCEDSYHNKIGHIETGVDIKKAREHYSFAMCGLCEVKEICAGRCVIPHIRYSKEKVEFYCACSKIIINKFKSVLPEIKELVKTEIIKEESLVNKLTRFTDVIP